MLHVQNLVKSNIYTSIDFENYDSAYCSMANDLFENKLFFALCSHKEGVSAAIFSFHVITKEIEMVFSLENMLGNSPQNWSLPHGKVHTPLFKGTDDNFYFGTHFAYPNCKPQKVQYEGGRIISFDPIDNTFDDHGILIKGEGIVTMVLDKHRMHCYVLTSPSFYFVDYDLIDRKITFISKIGQNNSSICRSLGIDNEGSVYGCYEPFQVFKYDSYKNKINYISTNFEEISEKNSEWESPKKQGANKVGRSLWRCIEFDKSNNIFYGVNASDSSLFSFNTKENIFKKIGEFHSFNKTDTYPNLSFTKYENKFFYSPTNGKFDYKLSEGILSTSGLFSYDSKLDAIIDHGFVFGQNNEIIYGSAASHSQNNFLYLIGAISDKNIIPFNGEQPFKLALIEIDVSSF